MSDAIAFDTHRFVKRLTESGFTRKQAETLADEQVALLNANLATKSDIAALKAEFKADIAALKAEFKADIAALKAELIKWMFGALIAQTGIVVALIKLL